MIDKAGVQEADPDVDAIAGTGLGAVLGEAKVESIGEADVQTEDDLGGAVGDGVPGRDKGGDADAVVGIERRVVDGVDDASAELEEGAEREALWNETDAECGSGQIAALVSRTEGGAAVDADSDAALDGEVIEGAAPEGAGVTVKRQAIGGGVGEAVVGDAGGGVDRGLCVRDGGREGSKDEGKRERSKSEHVVGMRVSGVEWEVCSTSGGVWVCHSR